jgi:hypothetical protein
MQKITLSTLEDLWRMRHLSVQGFLDELHTRPSLKFLLAFISIWWAARMIFTVIVVSNTIFFVIRLFKFVLF